MRSGLWIDVGRGLRRSKSQDNAGWRSWPENESSVSWEMHALFIEGDACPRVLPPR